MKSITTNDKSHPDQPSQEWHEAEQRLRPKMEMSITQDADWANPLGGSSLLTIDQLYQAFKARLIDELVATKDVSGMAPKGTYVEHFPLMDRYKRMEGK